MSLSIGSPAESRSCARGDPRQGGFTLLEVLVALAILGVAMVATLQALSGGLESTRRAKATAEALLLARSLLDQVGTEVPLVAGTTTGDFNADTHWTVRIARRSDDQADRFALFDVAVTITEMHKEVVTLATLRLGRVR